MIRGLRQAGVNCVKKQCSWNIQCMKEMNVYTFCKHGAMEEQGFTPIGTSGNEENESMEEGPTG